jgi:hypothetical protein
MVNETPIQKITGGCFCGSIRYEFDAGDYPVANCHCNMCRRTSGAPFVTWLVVPTIAFSYKTGAATELTSSEAGKRYFCNKCGTPVTCISSKHPEIVDVTLGSLDSPEEFSPTFNIYEDTRLPWTKI